jgi:hypothetical protein
MSGKGFMQLVGLLGTAMLMACALDPVQVTQDWPGKGLPVLDTLAADSTLFSPAQPGGTTDARPQDDLLRH